MRPPKTNCHTLGTIITEGSLQLREGGGGRGPYKKRDI
jgi:hypothetical protein